MSKVESTMDMLRENGLSRNEWVFLAALMVFCFIPSINQLFVDRLISDSGSEVLNIAGQIEWFDLINETILAFLTVPLYYVFNRVSEDKTKFSSRVTQTFTIGFVVYTLISLIVYLYANTLTAYMNAPAESLAYLRLETIGFVLGFTSSFMYVVLVVMGKWTYIVVMLVIKVLLLSIGNLYLIPDHGVTGVAMTNIAVNALMSVCALYLVAKEGAIQHRFRLEMDTIRDWVHTGTFSGLQILLSNIVYVAIVMKMINDVSEVGNYWLANNFIWGWLLIPVMAFSEIIRRDYVRGYRRVWNYLAFMATIVLAWVISIPLWGYMFTDIIGANDPDAILEILYKLVPFYVAYAISMVFDSILTSVGRTDYLFLTSAVVNIGYYGIVYGLFLAGYFPASIDFVIVMFGMGMVVVALCNAILCFRSRNSIIPTP